MTIAGALALWLELLVREAAVYVIVLMLPLAFAAMVWPARRVWAIRALELLVALILSKFAIVAVLSLGGAALDRIGHFGIGAAIAGIALLTLAAFAPWALLRLLPLSELASGVASGLRREAIGSARAMTKSVAGALRRGPRVTPRTASGRRLVRPTMMENLERRVRSAAGAGDAGRLRQVAGWAAHRRVMGMAAARWAAGARQRRRRRRRRTADGAGGGGGVRERWDGADGGEPAGDRGGRLRAGRH